MLVTLSEMAERLRQEKRPYTTKNDVIIAARARRVPIVNGRLDNARFGDLWFEVGYMHGLPRPTESA